MYARIRIKSANQHSNRLRYAQMQTHVCCKEAGKAAALQPLWQLKAVNPQEQQAKLSRLIRSVGRT
jgi:hypothetical protein